MHKVFQLINKGMQRDPVIGRSSGEYAYENMNIRITARDNETLLAVTNERGTSEIDVQRLSNDNTTFPETGERVVGYGVLNNILVLISNRNVRKVTFENNIATLSEPLLLDNFEGGEIGDKVNTLCVYESEDVQKVYFIDGIHQTRVVNICTTNHKNAINFLPLIVGDTTEISVSKQLGSAGIFSTGTIQYFFSYYTKHGSQTAIIKSSDVYYLSEEKGVSPDKTVNVSFKIDILNITSEYNYLRIYSIITNSVGSYSAKVVADIPIDNIDSVLFTDDGTKGYSINPQELFFIGGDFIIPKAIEAKDNTLFVGNISVADNFKQAEALIKGALSVRNDETKTIPLPPSTGLYPYQNSLHKSSRDIKIFKYGEYYKVGVQLQDQCGKWTEPIFISKVKNNATPNSPSSDLDKVNFGIFSTSISNSLKAALYNLGYIKIRPLVSYPNITERKVICQGVLCPTVFNVADRFNNAPFAQSSWFTRPNAAFDVDRSLANSDLGNRIEFGTATSSSVYQSTVDRDVSNNNASLESATGVLLNNKVTTFNGSLPEESAVSKGAWVEFRHCRQVLPSNDRGGELQNIDCKYENAFKNYKGGSGQLGDTYKRYPIVDQYEKTDNNEFLTWVNDRNNLFFIDQSIVTMHSPDIELDESLRFIENDQSIKLRIVGWVPITANSGDIRIQAESSPILTDFGDTKNEGDYTKLKGFDTPVNFFKNNISTSQKSRFGWKGLSSGVFWFDGYQLSVEARGSKQIGYMINPFQGSGSLANYTSIENTDGDHIPAQLKCKNISNIRVSFNTMYLSSNLLWNNNLADLKIFDSKDVTPLLLKSPDANNISDCIYYGNVDTAYTYPYSDNYSDDRSKLGYKIMVSNTVLENKNTSSILKAYSDNVYPISKLGGAMNSISEDYTFSKNMISMKYWSSPHAVLSLGFTSGGYTILPTTRDGLNVNL